MSEEEEYNERMPPENNEPSAPEMQSGGEVVETPQIGYDGEWVRFLSQLSEDESLSTIVAYIKSADLTTRAKNKLTVYITTLLDREFAVSRIADYEDFLRLLDKKQILDAGLPLGLTVYDMTPSFQHIVDLIAIKFDIKVRRSMGNGFERRILATSRTENVTEERVRNIGAKKSTGEKVRGLFGD